MDRLLTSASFWGLVGVVIGFALGEGARYIRYRWRIHRLKRVIDTELKSLVLQIDQKKEIIGQAIDRLKQKKYLPTQSIPAMTTAYKEFFDEVYEHLCPIQRNCVHNVYERIHLADKILDCFERDFLTAIKEKIITDPFQAYCDRLEEVQQALTEAQELIRGYLEGNPKDIYGLKG
jgi:hypothetical protein